MVLVEAMAFGKPVICSKEAGAVEMVANLENGFIFSPKQPEELAEHMGKFIGNKTLIKVMSDKSMQIMDCHSLADATKTFYESIEFIAK
jgi:glycosyltransferase involved in cell wall biosynthesis